MGSSVPSSAGLFGMLDRGGESWLNSRPVELVFGCRPAHRRSTGPIPAGLLGIPEHCWGLGRRGRPSPHPAGPRPIVGRAGDSGCCRKHRRTFIAKLTNTQLVVLSKASERDDGAARIPERMNRAAGGKGRREPHRPQTEAGNPVEARNAPKRASHTGALGAPKSERPWAAARSARCRDHAGHESSLGT